MKIWKPNCFCKKMFLSVTHWKFRNDMSPIVFAVSVRLYMLDTEQIPEVHNDVTHENKLEKKLSNAMQTVEGFDIAEIREMSKPVTVSKFNLRTVYPEIVADQISFSACSPEMLKRFSLVFHPVSENFFDIEMESSGEYHYTVMEFII